MFGEECRNLKQHGKWPWDCQTGRLPTRRDVKKLLGRCSFRQRQYRPVAPTYNKQTMTRRTLVLLSMVLLAALVPFFHWTLLGDIFFATVLFGGFALAERRYPALQASPA